MTNLPFALKSPAVLRPIFRKILLACIAGVLLVPTMARAELPVVVPETTAAALARMRDGNIRWAAFQLLALAIPLLILFTGVGARLRRMCESISGRRWFWIEFANSYKPWEQGAPLVYGNVCKSE